MSAGVIARGGVVCDMRSCAITRVRSVRRPHTQRGSARRGGRTTRCAREAGFGQSLVHCGKGIVACCVRGRPRTMKPECVAVPCEAGGRLTKRWSRAARRWLLRALAWPSRWLHSAPRARSDGRVLCVVAFRGVSVVRGVNSCGWMVWLCVSVWCYACGCALSVVGGCRRRVCVWLCVLVCVCVCVCVCV